MLYPPWLPIMCPGVVLHDTARALWHGDSPFAFILGYTGRRSMLKQYKLIQASWFKAILQTVVSTFVSRLLEPITIVFEAQPNLVAQGCNCLVVVPKRR